ncbi:hypothetical protein DNTS_001948 [Danionella cerebrum]|uniref:Testican-2 n=1 Tax=Danionella cerebrum TaxID=2873325 RepID=A0A553R192_9TELE|nr:hypothetical protein DNTS_001948 [Danionella translucida]
MKPKTEDASCNQVTLRCSLSIRLFFKAEISRHQAGGIMVRMNSSGCLLVSLLMLVRAAVQVDVNTGKEAAKAGNFMEDEQWLSTISQYSRKIKHWNRFRDVSCR